MMYSMININKSFDDDLKIVPWWSFGKTVLATAVFKLIDQKKLDINKNYYGLKGTLKQLLRHEAGLPDYASSKLYHEAVLKNDMPWSFDDMVEITGSGKLLFEPGEGWQYSNIGYYYISKLIEETTQMELEDALCDLLFTPLGINDVKVALDASDLSGCIHVKKEYKPRWLYHGMIIGSLRSACLFLHELATGNLISQSSFEIMQETYDLYFDIGNRPWKKPSYAHGLMIDHQEGVDYSIGHTGMGPDSVIAVYHYFTPPCTVAVSMETNDQGIVEFEVEKLRKVQV